MAAPFIGKWCSVPVASAKVTGRHSRIKLWRAWFGTQPTSADPFITLAPTHVAAFTSAAVHRAARSRAAHLGTVGHGSMGRLAPTQSLLNLPRGAGPERL